MANIFKAKTLVSRTGIFSHEVIAPNLVYNTGNQNISGNKTFLNNINVSGSGIFNALDLNNIDNLSLSGVDVEIISGNINLTNTPRVNGNLLLTGVDLSSYATRVNLALTGSTLNTKINNLSGYINSTSSNIVFTTGNQSIGGNKTFTGVATFSGQQVNLVDTALNLSGVGDMSFEGTNINFINSPVFISGTNLRVVGDVIGNNLVYNTGNQTISGFKTFATGVNISGHVGIGINNNDKFGLYVRKSSAGVTVNPDSNSIAVFEGSGNSHITVLASDAQTAGVVLGSPADNFGSYLSWNHDNSALKLATAKTNGFIQILTNNENEAVRITRSGDVGIGTISPSEKLQVVGNILANNLVYNTGNQSISGIKIFNSGLATRYISGVSGSSLGILGYSDSISAQTLRNINITAGLGTSTINAGDLVLMGGSLSGAAPNILKTGASITIGGAKTFTSTADITIKPSIDQNGTVGNIVLEAGLSPTYNGKINAFGDININGTSDIGSVLSSKNINIYRRGDFFGTPSQRLAISIDNNNVNFQNGMGLQVSGVQVTPSLYATSANLASTGSTLDTKINNLSGYVNSTSSNIVFTTGNQTISGNKTFIQDTTFGDAAQGDFLVISGNNFTVYGSGDFTSGLFVNSSPVATKSLAIAYAIAL